MTSGWGMESDINSFIHQSSSTHQQKGRDGSDFQLGGKFLEIEPQIAHTVKV